MWIGSIRLVVATKDLPDGGTGNVVTAVVLRDGAEVARLKLDYPTVNDLEPGAVRNYDYVGPTKLARKNDETPELLQNLGKNPMPYPSYGLEFSNGLEGHLKIRLRIHGKDMWIKDNIDLLVRFIRHKADSVDTLGWKEDVNWSYVWSWGQDVPMSTQFGEGFTTWTLRLD